MLAMHTEHMHCFHTLSLQSASKTEIRLLSGYSRFSGSARINYRDGDFFLFFVFLVGARERSSKSHQFCALCTKSSQYRPNALRSWYHSTEREGANKGAIISPLAFLWCHHCTACTTVTQQSY